MNGHVSPTPKWIVDTHPEAIQTGPGIPQVRSRLTGVDTCEAGRMVNSPGQPPAHHLPWQIIAEVKPRDTTVGKRRRS